MSSPAFSRYAPFIREYIYAKGWQDLKEVQNEACAAILDTSDSVIIASGTASGKTEAAFFPILTLLADSLREKCQVLYISPLKALINDQFGRLEELLAAQEIPLTPWHGDSSAALKKRLKQDPKGIVQMTPESLEALLMEHASQARRVFQDLEFVIIDEMHAFMGSERGEQLRCLLSRLEQLLNRPLRRIGLSATLPDYQAAAAWLQPNAPAKVQLAGTKQLNRHAALGIYALEKTELDNLDEDTLLDPALPRFLYPLLKKSKAIVFANTRAAAEALALAFKNLAAARRDPDIFFLHHGSVNAADRRTAEERMKNSAEPMVICATTTLELGIDVGDLDLIVQYGSAQSCSSFVQRLGRSGRQDGRSKMLFVHSLDSQPYQIQELPWDFLKNIAVLQLYIKEHFLEPAQFKPKPYSLLAHQTLAMLFEAGELSLKQLGNRILRLPPFVGRIAPAEYMELLQHLLAEDYLEKTETQTLLPGLQAEKLAQHFSFYSVFESVSEWHVYDQGEIGTLSVQPELEDVFVLNGQAWQVKAIYAESHKVYVDKAEGSAITLWDGRPAPVNGRLMAAMKQILQTQEIYPFLKGSAAPVLQASRQLFQQSRAGTRQFFQIAPNRYLLLFWCDSKINYTLECLLRHGLKQQLQILYARSHTYYVEFGSRLDYYQLLACFQLLELDLDYPGLVMNLSRIDNHDPYDFLLPDSLKARQFLANEMDLPAALNLLNSLQ